MIVARLKSFFGHGKYHVLATLTLCGMSWFVSGVIQNSMAAESPAAQQASRPKIGLALGGGGPSVAVSTNSAHDRSVHRKCVRGAVSVDPSPVVTTTTLEELLERRIQVRHE